MCKNPICILPPVVLPSEPPFITDDWLVKTADTIINHYNNEDGVNGSRVPPMALVRCSRGGKTRALKELARRLKISLPNTAIIFVSFNEFSNILEWETKDPLGALCRRIAFAARQNQTSDDHLIELYDSYKYASVNPNDIKIWLKNTPRILLIDEFNVLALHNNSGATNAKFYNFLRDEFLVRRGRYFVFSSHVQTVANEVAQFIDGGSDREVIVEQLPTISSIVDTAKNFDWPALNAADALYYGLVPAMIYEARLDMKSSSTIHLPGKKRMGAIDDCIQRGLVTDEHINNLMKSFITGEPDFVPLPLLQLMDSVGNKIQWIPHHMVPVLDHFAQSNSSLKYVSSLKDIVKLFTAFCNAKEGSGAGLETLCVITLLIRSMTQEFDSNIIPLDSDSFRNATVSFNRNFNLQDKTFGQYKNASEFLPDIATPDHFPHIAIYHPTNASFASVDIIVVAWQSIDVVKRFAIQVKEGTDLQMPEAIDTQDFDVKIWLRGKASNNSFDKKGWKVPSEADIVEFFGESGKHWTPKRLAALTAPTQSNICSLFTSGKSTVIQLSSLPSISTSSSSSSSSSILSSVNNSFAVDSQEDKTSNKKEYIPSLASVEKKRKREDTA